MFTSVTSEEEMAEETITNPNDAPDGSNVRIGSRGGMYYTSNNKPQIPATKKPDEVLSGPGYEVLMFKEQNGWRVKYKGPNAQKILDKLRGLKDVHS